MKCTVFFTSPKKFQPVKSFGLADFKNTGVVEITDYSFFTTEQIFGDFDNLNILCLRAGDLSRLIRPHSLVINFNTSVMGRYSEERPPASHFTEMKTYVQCNIQGQKLDSRCEINKFIFTYQLYRFILIVYNDVHHFFNNRAFVAK
jgi:hypothetical protein